MCESSVKSIAIAFLLCGTSTIAESQDVPVGTVITFAGAPAAVPANWAVCDGALRNRLTDKTLFDAIGTSWGRGDGATTFNLPDLRGLFLRGVDPQGTHDAEATARDAIKDGGAVGAAVGSFQLDATRMPRDQFATVKNGAHTHEYTHTPVFRDKGNGGNYWDLAQHPTGAQTSSNGDHTHTITGGDRETRPRNAAVYWIIKVR